MRKIREILRLILRGELSERSIARSCGVSRPSVAEYSRRVKEAGIGELELDETVGAFVKTRRQSKGLT